MADDPVPDTGTAEPEPTRGRRRRRAVRRVGAATRRLVEGAEDVASVVESVAGTASEALSDAGDALAETAIARRVSERRLRARHRRQPRPLPNLYRVHPEARLAPVRELGLLPIPIDEIVGTAVEGYDQRGLDFRPLPAFRSANWRARWQRIEASSERLESLPPIEVLRTADGYWVTDGHNRVGVAKALGQVDIDADVRAVILPGQASVRPVGPLAAVLVDSAGLPAHRRGRTARGPG